jgi:hypothetical protein
MRNLRFIGLDFSGSGSDSTAMICGDWTDKGVIIGKVWTDNKSTFSQRCNYIVDTYNHNNVDVIFAESNSMGYAYIEVLKTTLNVVPIATTRKSKPRMIELLKYHLESNLLDLKLVAKTILPTELMSYASNGRKFGTQNEHDDTVMSLAIALYGLENYS